MTHTARVTQAGERYQHRKGGTYRVLAIGKVQTDVPLPDMHPVVVYQPEQDGLTWVRPTHQFSDGRFTLLEDAPADPGVALTFEALRTANAERQVAWCGDQTPDLSFRGVELAGEVGEACNIIKKLERERQGWAGSRASKEHLARELGDVIICADLVALTAGIDLAAGVTASFNATSEKVGFPQRLAPSPVDAPRPTTDAIVELALDAFLRNDNGTALELHKPTALSFRAQVRRMRKVVETVLFAFPNAAAPDQPQAVPDDAPYPSGSMAWVNVGGLMGRHVDELRAHADKLRWQMENDERPAPPHGWTCFHCAQTFTTWASASAHFGDDPLKGRPECWEVESDAILDLCQEHDDGFRALADSYGPDDLPSALEAVQSLIKGRQTLAAHPVLPVETPAEGLRTMIEGRLKHWRNRKRRQVPSTLAYGDGAIDAYERVLKQLASTAPAPLSGRDGSLRDEFGYVADTKTVPDTEIRALFADEDDDEPLANVIPTHDGDWRRDGDDWRFWKNPGHDDDAALAAVPPETASFRDTVAPYAAATRMVRDTIGELFGPIASIESDEAVLLRGPEPHHEAEAQIEALQRVNAALTRSRSLVDVCERFITDQKVSCAEATAEDRVYEHAPELVEQIGTIVGFYRHADEEDDE